MCVYINGFQYNDSNAILLYTVVSQTQFKSIILCNLVPPQKPKVSRPIIVHSLSLSQQIHFPQQHIQLSFLPPPRRSLHPHINPPPTLADRHPLPVKQTYLSPPFSILCRPSRTNEASRHYTFDFCFSDLGSIPDPLSPYPAFLSQI